MKATRICCAFVLGAFLAAPAVQAQDSPKPGPEHAQLKKMEGTWDTIWKMQGMEEKGVATYKMDVGGLWMVSTFDSKMGNDKYQGRGLDSYDANKKKFVGVWVDSMSTTPMVTEGTFDAATKTMTMTGEAAGPDGKPVKMRMVTVMPDDNTQKFSMYMADSKEPMFTIDYKRRK